MEKKVARFQAEVAICIRNYNFDMVQISMLAALKIAHNCSRTVHNVRRMRGENSRLKINAVNDLNKVLAHFICLGSHRSINQYYSQWRNVNSIFIQTR